MTSLTLRCRSSLPDTMTFTLQPDGDVLVRHERRQSGRVTTIDSAPGTLTNTIPAKHVRKLASWLGARLYRGRTTQRESWHGCQSFRVVAFDGTDDADEAFSLVMPCAEHTYRDVVVGKSDGERLMRWLAEALVKEPVA